MIARGCGSIKPPPTNTTAGIYSNGPNRLAPEIQFRSCGRKGIGLLGVFGVWDFFTCVRAKSAQGPRGCCCKYEIQCCKASCFCPRFSYADAKLKCASA